MRMWHRVTWNTDDRLYFGKIVEYEVEATKLLIEFDGGDLDDFGYIEFCMTKQLFRDKTNNDGGEL